MFGRSTNTRDSFHCIAEGHWVLHKLVELVRVGGRPQAAHEGRQVPLVVHGHATADKSQRRRVVIVGLVRVLVPCRDLLQHLYLRFAPAVALLQSLAQLAVGLVFLSRCLVVHLDPRRRIANKLRDRGVIEFSLTPWGGTHVVHAFNRSG